MPAMDKTQGNSPEQSGMMFIVEKCCSHLARAGFQINFETYFVRYYSVSVFGSFIGKIFTPLYWMGLYFVIYILKP